MITLKHLQMITKDYVIWRLIGTNIAILAGEGYIGKNMDRKCRKEHLSFVPETFNSKETGKIRTSVNIQTKKTRVEAVFSQLSGQLNAERVLAKAFRVMYPFG